METIKYLGQGNKHFEVLVYTYSKEEWVVLRKERGGGMGPAFYWPEDFSIHIIQEEDFPQDIWVQGKKVKWEDVLYHEYIHYMQHCAACWNHLIPIDPKAKGVPMTRAFKKAYPKESWGIEAEAHWYMYRPKELGLKLVLA